MYEFDEIFSDRMLGLTQPDALHTYIRQTLNDPDIFRVDELKEDVKNKKSRDGIRAGDILAHYLSDVYLTRFRLQYCLHYARDNCDKYPEFIKAMKEVLADEVDVSVKDFIKLDGEYRDSVYGRYTDECKLLAIWLFNSFEHIIETNDNSYFE